MGSIRQNLFCAFICNAPGVRIAAAATSFSPDSVVTSASRLNRERL